MTLTENREKLFKQCLIGCISTFIICALTMVILKNLNLRTNFYDLGQYATILYGYHHAGISSYLFSTHAQPLIAPLSLIYATVESPAALQLFGSATVLSGLYFAVIKFTKPGLERWLGAMFLGASPITWYAILFDFHFEVFLFWLIPLFFHVAERNTSKPHSTLILIFLAFLVAIVKEPYALLSASLGLWLVIRHGCYRLGLAIAFFSLAYFFYVTTILIPSFTEGKNIGTIWNSAFGYLGNSPIEMIRTVASSPLNTVMTITTPTKWLYVALLVVPVLPLIFRNPSFMLPALPTLIISLLSTNGNHVGIAHQYAVASFLPLAIGALVSAQGHKRPLTLNTLTASVALCLATLIAFGPSPVSRLFWNQKVWQYELAAYWPDARAKAIVNAIHQYIPIDPTYVVSMQNSLQSARLSNRYHAMAFPNGVFESFATPSNAGERSTQSLRWINVKADYAVIDLKRPYFIRDQGCEWLWGKCQSKSEERAFLQLVNRLPDEFDLRFEHDGFRIYERRDARASRISHPPPYSAHRRN